MSAPPAGTGREVVVQLEDIRVGYGRIEILHNVSLEVRAGEFLAVLGANGAGKTTLLSTIAGLLTPQSGSVSLFGNQARQAPHRRARLGFAFIGDDKQIFPSLTVAQTLRLIRKAQTDPLTIFPELKPLTKRRVGLLSGGEQQMLALGRALAWDPRVIVVDELSQGLAPVIRDRLLGELRNVADQGATVIVVEQAAEAVLAVADKAAVLRRGELVDVRNAADWTASVDELVSTFLS